MVLKRQTGIGDFFVTGVEICLAEGGILTRKIGRGDVCTDGVGREPSGRWL